MPNRALPRFLNHADLVALNDVLLKKNGCFAFLRPHPLLIHTECGTWQNRFVLFCTGLYVVYHDFGCNYLDFFLDDSNCPSSMRPPVKHRLHKRTVLQTLRPSMVHGLLGDEAKDSFWSKIVHYYIPTLTVEPRGWSKYVDAVTEDQWMTATIRLRADADAFYDFLTDWADNAGADLREAFARSSRFQFSIDARVCEIILKENGVFKKSDLNVYLAKKDNAPNPFLVNWQNSLIEEYANNELKTPDDLYDRLCELIASDVQNRIPVSGTASSQIANAFGFSIPPQ